MTYHDLIGTHYQQDVNLDYIFQDVSLYNQRIMGPAHVVPTTDLAIRTALTGRGVAHLTFPVDTQEAEVGSDERSMRNVAGHTTASFQPPRLLPPSEDLERAAVWRRARLRPSGPSAT